jgi:hypothetical protein
VSSSFEGCVREARQIPMLEEDLDWRVLVGLKGIHSK